MVDHKGMTSIGPAPMSAHEALMSGGLALAVMAWAKRWLMTARRAGARPRRLYLVPTDLVSSLGASMGKGVTPVVFSAQQIQRAAVRGIDGVGWPHGWARWAHRCFFIF